MVAAFDPKTIAVIGAGPVGCVLAAGLSQAGFEVTLCDVVESLLAPAKDPGIYVEGAVTMHGKVARTITSIDELAIEQPDLIFVSVKATALPLISSAIENFHQPGTYVISWQNGIDTELELTRLLGARWVFRAVVNFGVMLPEPGRVTMAFHHPPHWLQEMDPESKAEAQLCCELLSKAGLPTNHATHLIDQVWQKAILNAALGPICAVTGKTMSQAMHDPYLRQIIEDLLKEGIRIARANELNLGWDYFRNSIDYLDATGDHKPSMLVDLENNRITEAEYINGKIAEYGDIAGVDAPYNKMIRALVKALET
ncbi:MAG: 2-dehydropantoate 2-reductase [Xanthomonadales bacterium]